jgi:hypothetical protein
LAVLATLPWSVIEAAVAPKLALQALPAKRVRGEDLLGACDVEFGGGLSPAGRPRLPIRLMASLLHLNNSFNLSDEELVERWAKCVLWQFFSGMDRGKFNSLNDHEERLLKRRQAMEPLIGHAKADHRMHRCWLQGAPGDALQALSCAQGARGAG